MGSKTWSARVCFIKMLESKYSTKEIFEELPIGKSLTELALPAIAGQLVTLIYNIADTFFIGRVNNPLMITATSLTFPIFAMTAPVAIVSGTGGGSLVSRLMGIYREDEAKKVASLSVYISFIMGFVYSLLCLVFMNPLLKFLGTSEEAYLFTRQYMMCVVVLGGIPTVLTSTMSNLLRSVGHSKEAGFGISMGGIINIILDPILMFVVLPDGLEVVGAGVATMFSNFVVVVYFIITYCKLKDSTPLGFSLKKGLPDKRNILTIFAVGIPSAATTLLFDINNMLLNKLMAPYGDKAVAAIGMTIKIERFSLNTCVGLCMGMTPLVAYNFSARRYDRMLDYVKTTRRRGIIISLVSIALYEAFAPGLTRFFINDPETVALGAAFLRRRAVASVFMFLNFYMVHFFQGIGSGKHTFWLSVVRYVGLCIPALYILNYFLGANGLAWAQAAGDFVNAIITAIVFSVYVKKNISPKGVA